LFEEKILEKSRGMDGEKVFDHFVYFFSIDVNV